MPELKKRADIDPRYKWNLNHIFADDAAWEQAMAAVKERAAAFAQYNGHVAEKPREAVRDYFSLIDALMPVGSYASLAREADNGDAGNQAKADRAEALMVQISTDTAFL